jgi:choline-sulfatase
MSFFEMSVRVPLLIHWPQTFSQRSVDTNVSLLDLLPTLVELANGGPVEAGTFVTPPDGASLVPAMTGGALARGNRIVSEYLAEGAIAPCFMLKDGPDKFIWCESDPPQLYDLGDDPDELINLAADPACANRVKAYEAELVQRYDPPALRQRIIRNQQVRLMVADALMQGRYTPWDYQPFRDASRRFMRNHLDLNEVEESARFPRPRAVMPPPDAVA